MSIDIRALEPTAVWNHFADLNAVPRPSKKEGRVIAFMKAFGESLGLRTVVDAVGNVIIYKPATSGLEQRPAVVMQGHLDMVHQKNADTAFDFDSQGIEMYLDGDWVRARGTTLGADNGIGVAFIMTILSSTNIPHPAIEALFTIDEETGMTGAMALEGGLLHGKYMLNLDTEDDRELTIGCAGGIDVTGTGSYSSESVSGLVGFRLSLRGLTGGHSGMDIHLGRGNANKLMNRVLLQAADRFGLRVHSVDGGSLRNAIPRESFAVVGLPIAHKAAFLEFVAAETQDLVFEHRTTDPNLDLSVEELASPDSYLSADAQAALLRVIAALHNGIWRMSPEIKDLVQTSNNVARILVKEGNFSIQCLTRSAVESEKMELARSLAATMKLCGAEVTLTGNYPGWAPRPDATIVQLMSQLYQEAFDHAPHVNACHAGLECGILGRNYPKMEMISFGPNIVGAHSPDERVQVSSVQKCWKLVLRTLASV